MSSKIFQFFTDSRLWRGSMAGLLLLFIFLPFGFSLTRYKTPQFNEYVAVHTAQLQKAISANPDFFRLLEQSNRNSSNLTPDALKMLSDHWTKTQGIDDFAFQILKNPSSIALQVWADEHLPVVEIVVTDVRGLVIAATRKTKHYDYSGREWWREVMAMPQGKVWHGSHEYDMPNMEEITPVAFTLTDPKTKVKKGAVRVVFSRAALNWAAA